jgi:hypothetical protein
MPRFEFPDDWPAPDEYLLELGRMTSIWGTLESNMNLAISLLAGYETVLDYRALILVTHSNFKQKVDIVSTLCEQLAPANENLRNYKSVVSKLQSAQKSRNKFAHNSIYKDQETGKVQITYASARGSFKAKIEAVNLNDIKEVTAKIHEASCALHSLITGKELKPMWERDA